MRESINIVNKLKEENIFPIPEFGDETHTKALCALHMEKTVFSETEKTFNKALSEIFNFFDIDISEKEKFLKAIYEYNEIIKIIISKAYETPLDNKGIFEYKFDHRYIKKDENDRTIIDLKLLQEEEAKYDRVNLFSGQVIIKYNLRDKEKIIVNNTEMNIPDPNAKSLNLDNIVKEMLDDNEKPDYTAWNNFLYDCKDRDVVSVYENGECKQVF